MFIILIVCLSVAVLTYGIALRRINKLSAEIRHLRYQLGAHHEAVTVHGNCGSLAIGIAKREDCPVAGCDTRPGTDQYWSVA